MFLNKKYFITISILLIINCLNGQSTFRGGFVAGFNAGQLDGDYSAGYHKLGLNAGIRSTIELKGRLQLQTEILFSQRGARTTQSEAQILRSCTLNYLEVPLLLNIRDWRSTTEGGDSYYKAYLSVGLSYGRLFSSNSNLSFTHATYLDRFKKNDISYMAGVGFNFNYHLGLTARIAKSFGLLYDATEFTAGPVTSLRGHYISFLFSWLF
jgi:hypothetical protein